MAGIHTVAGSAPNTKGDKTMIFETNFAFRVVSLARFSMPSGTTQSYFKTIKCLRVFSLYSFERYDIWGVVDAMWFNRVCLFYCRAFSNVLCLLISTSFNSYLCSQRSVHLTMSEISCRENYKMFGFAWKLLYVKGIFSSFARVKNGGHVFIFSDICT